MRYTLRHTFNVDEDTFWEKIFFDAEFNRAMYEDDLKFTVYRVLSEDRQADGSVSRRTECAPPIEVPAVAKKVLGDSTSYVEDGRFDPKSKRWTFKVIPAMGADKIKTTGEIWVEPRGDKKVERIASFDTTVKVFGVGKVLEAFIEKQTRGSFDQASSFTSRWIADKGL